MLNENIKTLRMQKSLSQEELAARLHVVRQTVSKWEQGLSVPDADMLIRLADIFETPVGVLLGEKLPDAENKNELQAIADKLEQLNALLAQRNAQHRRMLRVCAVCLMVAAGAVLLGVLLPSVGLSLLVENSVSASVGIIGGADGPTAIFVTGAPPSWGTIALIGAVCLAAIIVGIMLLHRARRK